MQLTDGFLVEESIMKTDKIILTERIPLGMHLW